MAKKKSGSTKKTGSGKTTEQQRAAAIAEIDARLDGEAKAEKAPAPKKKAAATKGAKATKPAKASKTKTPKEKKPRKASGLDLAAQVLAKAGEPMNAKSIAERVIAAGWQTSGKTPHATLYAAMLREIQDKGTEARFVKTHRGLFTSRKRGA